MIYFFIILGLIFIIDNMIIIKDLYGSLILKFIKLVEIKNNNKK
jgi:hypothetical protein